jgi:hypothetical protein
MAAEDVMEMTALEKDWQTRLIMMAAEASSDELPCVEQACLVVSRILELPRKKQLVFAQLAHSLVTLLMD